MSAQQDYPFLSWDEAELLELSTASCGPGTSSPRARSPNPASGEPREGQAARRSPRGKERK